MSDSQKWFLLGCSILLIALLYVASPVLMPFLVAAFLAYLADPMVERLEKWHFPRTLGVVIVFALFFMLITALAILLIPLLEEQIVLLYQQIPKIITWVQEIMLPWLNQYLNSKGLGSVSQAITQTSTDWQQAGTVVKGVVKTLSQSGIALINFGTSLVLIPVVGFYLLRDWGRLMEGIRQLLPRPIEPTVVRLANECDEVIGAFFRGQLLVMFSLGAIYSTGLWIVGLDLALIIGISAGLASIVPYLGFIVGILAAVIATLIQFQDGIHLIYVVVVFIIGQMAESMVLTPLLVGDRIGLHPVAVIFAILIGGHLFGFVGILIALPVAAVVMVVLRHILQRYIGSNFYYTQNRSSEP